MIKRKMLIGSSVALLLMVALFACSRKSTSVENSQPQFSSGADSNWLTITLYSDIDKWPVVESVRKSGTHVTIGPEGNEIDSMFDFGYAPQVCHISHVFWLHNGYDDSLTILRVEPG